jgi:predicted transcriptional regulator
MELVESKPEQYLFTEPGKCEFLGWACYPKGLTKRSKTSMCERQGGYEIHEDGRLMCEDKELLLSDPSTFVGITEKRNDYDIKAYILAKIKQGIPRILIILREGSFKYSELKKYEKSLLFAGSFYYEKNIPKITDLGLECLQTYCLLRRILSRSEKIEKNVVFDENVRRKLITSIYEKEYRNLYEKWALWTEDTSKKPRKKDFFKDYGGPSEKIKRQLSILREIKFLKLTKDNRYKPTERGKQFADTVLYLHILTNFSFIPDNDKQQ